MTTVSSAVEFVATFSRRVHLGPAALPPIFALTSAVISAVVLLGWLTGLHGLTSWGAGPMGMKFNTAVCVMALSIAAASAERLAGSLLAGGVAMAAAAALVDHSLPITLVINELVVNDSTGASGRMSVGTAVSLFALALLILLRPLNRPRWITVGATAVLAMSLLATLGHAYAVPGLPSIWSSSPAGLVTSVALSALALSLLAAIECGFIPWLIYGADAGAVLLRRLVPVAVVGLPVMGYLRVLGQQAGWYGTSFGAALHVVVSVAALLAVSAVAARRIAEFDNKRVEALHHLQDLNWLLRDQAGARVTDLANERLRNRQLQEHRRHVADINDRALQRIFAAGMHISSAARREPESSFAQRSPAVLADLDDAITDLRMTIQALLEADNSRKA